MKLSLAGSSERRHTLCLLSWGMAAVFLVPVLSATGSEASSPPGLSRRITSPSRPLKRPVKAEGKSAKTSLAGSFWKTVSVLGVLVALLLIGGRLLRKHAPHLGGGLSNEVLEVLGKRTIDRGQLVYLVRLGSRILVVGSSPGGLQTLAEITDPLEIDYLAGLCRPTQPSNVSQGFLTLFQRKTVAGAPRNRTGERPVSPPSPTDFSPTAQTGTSTTEPSAYSPLSDNDLSDNELSSSPDMLVPDLRGSAGPPHLPHETADHRPYSLR